MDNCDGLAREIPIEHLHTFADDVDGGADPQKQERWPSPLCVRIRLFLLMYTQMVAPFGADLFGLQLASYNFDAVDGRATTS